MEKDRTDSNPKVPLNKLVNEAREAFTQSSAYQYLNYMKNCMYISMIGLIPIEIETYRRREWGTLAMIAGLQALSFGVQRYLRYVIKKVPEIHAERIYSGEEGDFSRLACSDFDLSKNRHSDNKKNSD